MTQHITIGFDKSQAMIALLLTRFAPDTHGIQINHEKYDVMIHITDNHLEIGDATIPYPLLLIDVITAIKRCYLEQSTKNKEIT
jgi:ABC-type uncharacterized transport system permease subunit